MSREELILSDEYIETNVDCIITSKRPIRQMREEMWDFIKNYRDELNDIQMDNEKHDNWDKELCEE